MWPTYERYTETTASQEPRSHQALNVRAVLWHSGQKLVPAIWAAFWAAVPVLATPPPS